MKKLLLAIISLLMLIACTVTMSTDEVETPVMENKTTTKQEQSDLYAEHFSFTLPDGYRQVNNEIWENSRYNDSLNYPDYNADFCHTPDLYIIDEPLNESLETFAKKQSQMQEFDYEKYGNEFNSFEKVWVGDREFIRMMTSDLHSVLSYYTEHNGRVFGLVDLWTTLDKEGTPIKENDEFMLSILETLRFK